MAPINAKGGTHDETQQLCNCGRGTHVISGTHGTREQFMNRTLRNSTKIDGDGYPQDMEGYDWRAL